MVVKLRRLSNLHCVVVVAIYIYIYIYIYLFISAVDCIWMPPGGSNVTETLDELKAAAFGNLPIHFQNTKWLCERAILAPQNDSVAHVAS